MKKRKSQNKQADLFAQEPQRMQWQHLALASRHKTENLLAKLLLCFAIESQTKETSDALENSF